VLNISIYPLIPQHGDIQPQISYFWKKNIFGQKNQIYFLFFFSMGVRGGGRHCPLLPSIYSISLWRGDLRHLAIRRD